MAGRKIRVRWAEADTVEALHAAYRQERQGKLRTRLHGLWLVRRGETIGQAAASVGVHYRTVQQWLRWYEAGGLAAGRAHRQGGQGQPPKLTAAQQLTVGAEVASGRFRVAAEIGDWITTTYGVTYRPGGLSSLLKRLRCRPKVPRPLHAQADLDAQAAWKKGGSRRPWSKRA